MKPISWTVLVCLLALLPAASSSAAETESYWQPGAGVQVGGVYFHVVSVAANSEALFRVSQRLHAAGAEEHPDCYRVSRTFYHRESCPAVQEHFRHHASDANSSAPMATPASYSSGSHPINYLQGNYEAPARPYWSYTGLWYTPWFASGARFGHGGRPHTRPGFGPRPGFRAGRVGGHGGGFSFRLW